SSNGSLTLLHLDSNLSEELLPNYYGLIVVKGKVGIGTAHPVNKLDIAGRVAIGSTSAGTQAAPTDGLLVEGNVDIGTSAKPASLTVLGQATIERATAVATKKGEAIVGSFAENGYKANLKVAGKVGIGNSEPEAILDITSSVTADNSYTAVSIAPTITATNTFSSLTAMHLNPTFQGGDITKHYALIVEGKVGIDGALAVTGNAGLAGETHLASRHGNVIIGEEANLANLQVAGKVGIGIENINSRLHAQGAGFIEGTGKIISDDSDKTKVTGITTDFQNQLHPGDLLKVGQETRIITEVNSNESLTIDRDLSLTDESVFSYQQPSARLENSNEDSNNNTQFVVLGNGNTGIGTAHPVNKFDVFGAVAIGSTSAGSQEAPPNGLMVDGNVWIGSKPPQQPLEEEEVESDVPQPSNAKLYLKGDLYVDGEEVDAEIRQGRIFAKNISGRNVRGTNFTQISSKVLKEEISDLHSQEVTEILKALNPVKFIYKEDEAKIPHAGFIAEDTPDLLTSVDKQEIKVFDVVAVLTKAVKDRQKVMNDLVNVVKKQQHLIADLTKKVEDLEKKLDSVNKSMKSTQ
ncbi:MAG: tail fiber domain-containing protein, partial [Prochloraceae cyanobacterium]|nr:tail fiber domain-containing protein [Prochloraceae cyanobacterium]